MIQFKSGMVEETKKATFLPHGIFEVLIFIGLFTFSQMITTIVMTIIYVIHLFTSGEFDLETGPVEVNMEVFTEKIMSDLMLPMLYATALMIVMVIVYTKSAQKRSMDSIGLGKKNAIKDYLIGYLVGIIMFSVIVLILVLTNQLSYQNATLSMWPIVIVFFIGFLIQGASEEVAMRGYLMPSLAAKHNLMIAVLVNSVIFGILHATNPGVTFLSIVNIILFGLFASVYTLKMNNIWGICALHSAWNFVQGNVYGLEVSGMNTEQSLWIFKATGNSLLTGGSFGPEGGLITTLVLTISTIIVILLKTKRNPITNEAV